MAMPVGIRRLFVLKIDLEGMAGVTGLEPATSGVTGRHSNQLSYTPLQNGTAAPK